MIADFFDTMGTLIGVGEQAGFLDEEGQYPQGDLKRLLIVDSLGAVLGGLFGSSSATTYIESAAGVSEGGRSGLTSVVVGLLFLLSMFIAPIAGIVPGQATAPALILVGFYMMSGVKEINFTDIEQGIPAMLVMMIMPFTYSITNGIGLGFISFVFIKVVRGKSSEVHPMMWGAAVAFLLYFLVSIIQSLVAG
jgi:AGZA family xanthine/uracil permease-like MFS transporter